jgi:hypothetical protein
MTFDVVIWLDDRNRNRNFYNPGLDDDFFFTFSIIIWLDDNMDIIIWLGDNTVINAWVCHLAG